MRDKVAAFLHAHTVSGRLYCAVSGGADSMALLDCLWSLQTQFGLEVHAVHFHHHLRHSEADRDAQFVSDFCTMRKIPLECGHGDVTAWAKAHGQSLEQAARTLRYAFFESLPPGPVATAHTADDNLETALLHLVRGASLRGLCGIPPVRGRFLRPMLTVTRPEVLAYLDAHNIPHMEDSTNNADDCLRNRIRHHVIPQLLAENPSVTASFSRAAARMRQEDDFLEQLAGDVLARAQDAHGNLRCSILLDAPPVLRSRAILQWLYALQVPSPGSTHVDAIDALLTSPDPSAQRSLPGGITILRQYDLLTRADPLPPISPRPLRIPGLTPVPEAELILRCDTTPHPGAIALAANRVGALQVRARQPGDTIRLHAGRKTLKKLMIDRKIPAALRARIPVLADEAGVAAVIGIGADLDRIPNSEDSALYISILEKEEI
jgi:tRNA(Ile)-lysidine synthase